MSENFSHYVTCYELACRVSFFADVRTFRHHALIIPVSLYWGIFTRDKADKVLSWPLIFL